MNTGAGDCNPSETFISIEVDQPRPLLWQNVLCRPVVIRIETDPITSSLVDAVDGALQDIDRLILRRFRHESWELQGKVASGGCQAKRLGIFKQYANKTQGSLCWWRRLLQSYLTPTNSI